MNKTVAIWIMMAVAAAQALSADSTNVLGADDELPGMIATITNRWRQLIEAPKDVTLNGNTKAKHVLFCQTWWELKTQGQSPNDRAYQAAMNLPEAERLNVMNRLDDFTEMWFIRTTDFPEADHVLKSAIQPSPRTNQHHRELAYLGKAHGFACFAFMPIYEWTSLQATLNCQGGDDPLVAAIRGLSIEDRGSMTANGSAGILSGAGAKALPHLEPLFATTNYPHYFYILHHNKSPEAAQLLLKFTQSPDREFARQARGWLAATPHVEFEDLYFKWLADDAGRTSVMRLLGTCATLNKPRLAPVLPRVLATPNDVREMRLAFELSRSLAGKEIPAALLQAETIIMRYGAQRENSSSQQEFDKAVEELTQAEDVEAAACIGVSLAVATTKGGLRQANQAGVSILKTLPDQQGRKMAKVLYDSCDDDNVKCRLKEVVEE